MTQRVVLHIGAMKTGTTYLQSILSSNRDRLNAGGVVTGRMLGRPSGSVAKVLARPSSPELTTGWTQLARRARRAESSSVVISSEYLSFAKPHQIEALLRPFEGVPVEVVLAVRDQVTGLPSQWQTFSRNFGDATWPDYLRQIDPARSGDRASKAWRTYYRAQELDRIVTDWSAHPGVTRVHVLPLPRKRTSDDSLWHTFAGIVGASHVEIEHPTTQVNPSIGHESAQMLQDLGRRWHAAGCNADLVRQVMRPLIIDALQPRRSVEKTPQIDQASWDFAVNRNECTRDAIETGVRSGRVELHGSLDELTTLVNRDDLPEQAPRARKAEMHHAARALVDSATRILEQTPPRPTLTYRGTIRTAHKLITGSPQWRETVLAPRGPAAV